MYHAKSIAEVLRQLKTAKVGLSPAEAARRLREFGPNVLPRSGEAATRFKIFISQWKSPLLVILISAGLISGLLGETLDMAIILTTAVINAGIGFFQENKASRALRQLQTLVRYRAIVCRGGHKQEIASEEIVPGDILFIAAGDRIEADGRLIQVTDLEVNEAVLTGESEPVRKFIRMVKPDTTLADRENMAYRGTVVTTGAAALAVSATGDRTEIGQIAHLVKITVEGKTPLQQQLHQLSRQIAVLVMAVALGIMAFGLLSSGPYRLVELFETAVAVAVAAIPEGLVISLTVILAIGMQHILKRRALVRKLLAAETLGSVSVICADKTGTLTEGKMRVTRLVTAQEEFTFEELKLLEVRNPARHPDALLALRIGLLCNDAGLQNPGAPETEWRFYGDTTETALVYAGARIQLWKHELDHALPRLATWPFTSERKLMATLHQLDAHHALYVKGAPEVILKRAKYVEENGERCFLTEKRRAWFSARQKELAGEGLRLLALAYKPEREATGTIKSPDVTDLILVGLVALSDPVRQDVKSTLAVARQAGIQIVMITGDHLQTAQHLAGTVGIPNANHQVFDGARLEHITDKELQLLVRDITVFARVDPRHKIRIVQAWQQNGEVVAMTGDGVNDAPALKAADVGVALGSGTDVAKETADLVLVDDSLETIMAAVEEGRGIYQNIKKVVLYLLSGSFAEVVLILGSLIGGWPLAVLPAQILWVNIIEDSFPNIALAFDRGDKDNMHEPPRPKHTSIFDPEMKVMIAIISLVSNLILLALFVYFWRVTNDIALTRTIIFVGLGIDSLLYIYAVRSRRQHLWQMPFFDNHYLTLAVVFGWLMLISAVYLPPLQVLLRTVPLSFQHWFTLTIFGLFNVALIELVKEIFLIRKSSLSES